MRKLPKIPGRLALSGFGLGAISPAPGSLASFVTFAIVVLVEWGGGPLLAAAAAAVLLLYGTVATLVYGRVLDGSPGRRDPRWVVSDEFAGQALACVGALPFGLGWAYVASFVFFRVFDVTKPGPVRRLERIPGGAGVLADDLAAGLMAAVLAAGIGLLGRALGGS